MSNVVTFTIDLDDIPNEVFKTFNMYCSSWSPQMEYNLVFLRVQQQYANDQLQARGHIFLNEVYDLLGFKRSRLGTLLGWTKDEVVDFGIQTVDAVVDLTFNIEGVVLL